MRLILVVMMLLLVIPISLSSTIISSSQNVSVGEVFSMKIYAEDQYMIIIPKGCEATKYTEKVSNNILYAGITDNPEFKCMDRGEKVFGSGVFIQNNWVQSEDHIINVENLVEDIISNNDTFVKEGLADDLNITMNTSYNESVRPITTFGWILIFVTSILLIIVLVIAIGIYLAL